MKTVLHIIDSLGRGGAETMLVTVTRNLKDYRNVVVTLYSTNEFADELKCDQFICLNLKGSFFIPAAAFRLRKIIKEHNVDVVHSHLFWSSIVARLGTPRQIPLITTIHCFVASSIEYRPWKMKVIERLTYKLRKSIIVAVAKGAVDEYFNFIKMKPYKACYLHTFVDKAVFKEVNPQKKDQAGAEFKIISVGNLKEQKNHIFLIEAFKELAQQNVTLDIYGSGVLKSSLQKRIDEEGLRITLKGQVKNIQQYIQQYDLFVMSSSYEGFSLSVLEAMALQMPLLLSDIVSFREQCADTASYYDLNSTADFIDKLLLLINNRQQLNALGAAASERVLNNFTLEKHLHGLRFIYMDALASPL